MAINPPTGLDLKSAPLSGRPTETASAQQMVVQVKNRLTGVGAAIGNHTKPVFRNPPFLRQLRGDLKYTTRHLPILRPQIQKGLDMLARDNQNVHGRLRPDILKSHHRVVFIDDIALNLSLDNSAKETVSHLSALPIQVQRSRLQSELQAVWIV